MNKSLPDKTEKTKSDFGVRLVSAIFMAVFTVLVSWLGGQTFFLFAAILSIFILMEYRGIVLEKLVPLTGFVSFAFLLLTIVAYGATGLMASIGVLALGIVSLLGLELFLGKRPYAAAGLAYAALPFIALVDIRGEMGNVAGLALIFVLYGCVWGADSFAYLVGRSIGGPKLAPSISPNKTWSGFIGSLVGGVAIAALAAYFFEYSPGITFVLATLLIAIVSQVGDLIESVLKRKFDKKDSGTLIPGHGGVLDRVDGLIFASVFMWLFGAGLFMSSDAALVENKSRSNHIVSAILPTQ